MLNGFFIGRILEHLPLQLILMNTYVLKYFMPLLAACTLTVTSCGTDNSAAEAQAKVDSIVAAKTGILKIYIKRNTDSLINIMALQRADSIFPVQATKPAVAAKK